MSSWTLRIDFLSDWQIGSGAGIPGSTDCLVLKDADGLPCVPGKSLTGSLRNSAEWIAEARGDSQTAAALETLFGRSIQARDQPSTAAVIGISSAEFSPGFIHSLGNGDTIDPELLRSLYIVRPGIRIDPQTGSSRDQYLFTSEQVRGGCSLYATVTSTRQLTTVEDRLLHDAVKAVHNIGGRRRRGAGKCRLTLERENTTPVTMSSPPLPLADGPFVTIPWRITTLQPVIINRATIGNVDKSESYIPASRLLPLFYNQLRVAVGEQVLRHAVMDGRFRVSDFLPQHSGQRSLPLPLTFAKIKDSAKVSATQPEYCNQLVDHRDPAVQMTSMRSGSIVCSGTEITWYPLPVLGLRTHNTIDDQTQRSTSEVGGLYSCEAIPAGTIFQGSVSVSTDLWPVISRPIAALTRLQTSIGQSRKDEYGNICLERLAPVPSQPAPGALVQGRYLVVYLASDTLLRNEYGSVNADPSQLKAALAQQLGLSLDEYSWNGEYSPLGGTRVQSVRIVRHESWQCRWNLPRPSMVSIQAGSVFVYTVNDPQNWDPIKALALQQNGLGERLSEGCGQLLLNPAFLTDPRLPILKGKELHTERNPRLSGQAKSDGQSSDSAFLSLLRLDGEAPLYPGHPQRYFHPDSRKRQVPVPVWRPASDPGQPPQRQSVRFPA